jgi:nicotinate-nucleotide adenylyltransferase
MTQARHASFGSIRVKPPPAGRGQRIGVMGGSFNPPHEGHRVVAATAHRRLALDRLWWVVTPANPLKPQAGSPDQAARIAASHAFAPGPRVTVTGFEAELGTPYTAVTLAFLVRRYPTARLVWVMGADNLATFHRWRRWRDIARMVPIAVVDRPSWRLKALASPAARALARARIPESRAATLVRRRAPCWVMLTTRLSPASSTALRRRPAAGG